MLNSEGLGYLYPSGDDIDLSEGTIVDLPNFKVFRRNSDRVKSELMNYFLMFGIIMLFGLSVAKSKVEYSEGAAPNFNAISPAYYNQAFGMKSSKYYLGNTETLKVENEIMGCTTYRWCKRGRSLASGGRYCI